ncbi:NAD(P)-dependent oxidoreductase [Salana multivorans]
MSTRPEPSTAQGIAVYGCGRDEAELFRVLAPRFDVEAMITETPLSEANAHLAVGSTCISVSHKAPVTSATLRALGRLGVEYISTRSVGCNHINVRYAESIGISVGNVAYSPDSVADYTLMLILMALRHAKSVLRRGDVHDYRLNPVPGRELRDLTVGVVGTGRIGTAVIDRLRGFGSRVLAHDSGTRTRAGSAPLDELLELSDVVTLHVPLAADTRHLLDRRRFAQMKPGAVVVNTSRGALINTRAMLAGLVSGRLAGAALDVLEGEEGIFYENNEDKPVDELLAHLQRLPNVILSPHTAFYTDHALADTVENTLINCQSYESRKHHV